MVKILCPDALKLQYKRQSLASLYKPLINNFESILTNDEIGGMWSV